jgi:hypothetical protein
MDLIQRLITRKVTGKVISKDFDNLGIPKRELTCYKIQDDSGIIHMVALLRHQETPKIGDEVEVEVRRLIPVLMRQEYPNIINNDGSLTAVRTNYGYLKIKNFRIL